MRTTTSTRAVSSVVAWSLLVAACGSESGAGDADAFCDELRRLDADESVDMDEDFEAAMGDLERVRDLAPSEIRSDIDVVVDKFGELEELEADSSGDGADDLGAALALAFDPKFIAAAEKLETFGVEECGLEPPSAEDGEISFEELDDFEELDNVDDVDEATTEATTEDAADAASAEGQLVTEPADVPDPLYDPFFDDEPLDTSELSIDGAQYFLDVNYTDARWRTKLGSWSIFGVGSSEVSAGGLDVTASEAPEVCSALLEYLGTVDADTESTIVVTTYSQDDSGMFGEEEELLRTTVADGC